jgi:dienelactone hydrolase
MSQDQRVRAATENWAPRFVANGVDINDFQRITASVERWDEWCAAWSLWGEMHEQLGLEAEADGFFRSAAEHFFQAAMMYQFGKFMFFHKPEEYKTAHCRVVELYERGMPYFDYPGERVEIPYESGATIYGILRKPWHAVRPPVVIISPGLDSVKEEMHEYGNDFLRRGMAVLAVDGPGQGEMEFEHPMRFDYEAVAARLIDYLETRGDVDSGRVGMMGVSVGGYYAVRTAAHEDRLAAAIALATGYSMADYFDRVPILTREAFVHRLKAPDEETARAMLRQFDLHGVVQGIRCPLLVVMGRQDRLFPAEETAQMAADAGEKAELLMYDDGNHVCNNIPYKYRPKQADWMSRALKAA